MGRNLLLCLLVLVYSNGVFAGIVGRIFAQAGAIVLLSTGMACDRTLAPTSKPAVIQEIPYSYPVVVKALVSSLYGHLPDNIVTIDYDKTVSVILTFDDGPDSRSGEINGTRYVLDLLQDHNFNAVFFIQTHARSDNGNYYRAMDNRVGRPLVERMHRDGHLIAIHTGIDGQRAHAWVNHHPNRERLGLLAGDLSRAKKFIKEITGEDPRYVRPPFGEHNRAVRERYRLHDLQMVLWDIDSYDSRSSYRKQDIIEHLQNQVRSLDKRQLVILFHDIDRTTYSSDNLHTYLTTVEQAVADKGYLARFSFTQDEIHEILGR